MWLNNKIMGIQKAVLLERMPASAYAKLRGISAQCVCKAIRDGRFGSKSLKGVVAYEKIGNMRILKVDLLQVPTRKKNK